MSEIICICIGCIFLSVGGLMALLNWYYKIAWIYRRINNPQYKRPDGVTPFIGGDTTCSRYYFSSLRFAR